LHAWKKYGLEAAQARFNEKYDKPRYIPPWMEWEELKHPSFEKVVRGKIEFLGMVRGKDDKLYLYFLDQLWRLDNSLGKKLPKKPIADNSPKVTNQYNIIGPVTLVVDSTNTTITDFQNNKDLPKRRNDGE
jgi:hypothetical protein